MSTAATLLASGDRTPRKTKRSSAEICQTATATAVESTTPKARTKDYRVFSQGSCRLAVADGSQDSISGILRNILDYELEARRLKRPRLVTPSSPLEPTPPPKDEDASSPSSSLPRSSSRYKCQACQTTPSSEGALVEIASNSDKSPAVSVGEKTQLLSRALLKQTERLTQLQSKYRSTEIENESLKKKIAELETRLKSSQEANRTLRYFVASQNQPHQQYSAAAFKGGPSLLDGAYAKEQLKRIDTLLLSSSEKKKGDDQELVDNKSQAIDDFHFCDRNVF